MTWARFVRSCRSPPSPLKLKLGDPKSQKKQRNLQCVGASLHVLHGLLRYWRLPEDATMRDLILAVCGW